MHEAVACEPTRQVFAALLRRGPDNGRNDVEDPH
jgi:hypothetical protein